MGNHLNQILAAIYPHTSEEVILIFSANFSF
jgi:hypothetical protein